MDTFDRELRSIFGDDIRATVIPDALLDSVTARAARRRAGRLAGASLGAIAAIGLAASAAVALGHGSSPAVRPAATPSTPDFLSGNPLGLRCGDPGPSSLIGSPDRGEFNVYETAVEINAVSGSGVVYYPLPSPSAPEEARVHAFYETRFSGVVIARDGRVVAWTESVPTPGSMRWTSEGLDEPGGEVTTVAFTSAGIIWCPEAGGQAQVDGVPEPGSYLTYPYGDTTAR